MSEKETTQESPAEFNDLIGTKQTLGGGLFSRKKATEYQEYDILDWRFGSGVIMDMKTMTPMHPTVELLVKAPNMRRSRWTRGFPCRSIKLEE